MRNETLGVCIDQDARCSAPAVCSNCGQAPAQCRCASYKHAEPHCQQSRCSTCGECSDCPAQRRCGQCGECACARQGSRCNYHHSPAMVYAAHHDAENIYNVAQAIARGTLFPCLDKPMCRECTGDPCFTKEQALNFAAWEIRLYLNTHPCDEKAQALLQRLCQQAADDSYACALLPRGRSYNQWLHKPWPWENNACCGKEA